MLLQKQCFISPPKFRKFVYKRKVVLDFLKFLPKIFSQNEIQNHREDQTAHQVVLSYSESRGDQPYGCGGQQNDQADKSIKV